MLNYGTKHVFKNDFNSVHPFKKMGVFAKNGYCEQNTYITWLMYCVIAKYCPCELWDENTYKKIVAYHRIPSYEDSEFNSQVDDLKTIELSGNILTYWYWKRGGGKYNAGDDYNKYLVEKLY